MRAPALERSVARPPTANFPSASRMPEAASGNYTVGVLHLRSTIQPWIRTLAVASLPEARQLRVQPAGTAQALREQRLLQPVVEVLRGAIGDRPGCRRSYA